MEARGLAVYTEKDMEEWPAWRDYLQEVKERKNSSASQDGVSPQELGVVTEGDPVEILEATAQEYNDGGLEEDVAFAAAAPGGFLLESLAALGDFVTHQADDMERVHHCCCGG